MDADALVKNIRALINDERQTRYPTDGPLFTIVGQATRIVFNKLLAAGVYPAVMEDTFTLSVSSSSVDIKDTGSSDFGIKVISVREVFDGEWRNSLPIPILDEQAALRSVHEVVYIVRQHWGTTGQTGTVSTKLFLNRKITVARDFRVSFCKVPNWEDADPSTGISQDMSIPDMMDDLVAMYGAALTAIADGPAYRDYLAMFNDQLRDVIAGSTLSDQTEVADVYPANMYTTPKRYG